MAELQVDGGELLVRLSPLEKLGALRGDVRVPRAAVCDIRWVDDLWQGLGGVRAPGTGFPGVIAAGTRRGRGIKDFTAVYGRTQGIAIDLNRGPFGSAGRVRTRSVGGHLRVADARNRVRQ